MQALCIGAAFCRKEGIRLRRMESAESRGLASLFPPSPEVLIRAALEGVMGGGYRPDGTEPPRCAQLILGDFCLFGGGAQEDGAEELARHLPRRLLCIPGEPAWLPLLERVHPGRCSRLTRYAFRAPAAFDRTALCRLASGLPGGCRLQPIGEGWYRWALASGWARDLVSQFPSYAAYRRLGLGLLVLEGEEPVCGASSYAACPDGIEIQIDTRTDRRRRGLAAACGAALILACLKRGIQPGWDAANPASAALAEKLGYRPAGAYTALEIAPAAQPPSLL